MERTPFDIDAKEILIRSQNGEITCLFTANAVTDIFYLYSKARNTQTAKAALDFLLTRYNVITVTREDCINALALPIDDFEDALVAVCAQKVDADHIVTRDDKFLRDNSPVKIITPKALVIMLNK